MGNRSEPRVSLVGKVAYARRKLYAVRLREHPSGVSHHGVLAKNWAVECLEVLWFSALGLTETVAMNIQVQDNVTFITLGGGGSQKSGPSNIQALTALRTIPSQTC